MTLLLAPMEGLLDAPLRDVLTRFGGIDRCVSEFIRITDQLLPARVFTRVVPELLHGSRTPAGVPVRPQLLGSDPACLADNAALLATLAPAGIDLNFGCPAKVVNRHRGGAVLLDEPDLVGTITAAVRRAVPLHVPVSAKMRLGNQDDSRAVDCAQALADAGAAEIVVHARTKADAYRPPAYWDRIRRIREAVAVPIVANGEIWNAADAARCRAESGCHALMLGRGMVADPGLALAIRAGAQSLVEHADDNGAAPSALAWSALEPQLAYFWHAIAPQMLPRHRAGRLKQWLNFLRRRYPQAQALYETIRTMNDPAQVDRLVFAARTDARAPASGAVLI